MRYKDAILDLLSQRRHLRVEELFAPLKERYPFISLATVYRNVKSLEKKGEVVAFLHPDGAVRYELPAGQHHQHLVCESCGVVIEIQFGFVDELSQHLKERANFSLHPHRLSMVGRCVSCQ